MRIFASVAAILASFPLVLSAAPNRIVRIPDNNIIRPVPGSVHRFASAAKDRGEAAPDLWIDHAIVLVRPSAAQQADLEQLLRDQRNPASASYHRWLTPEEYADRFGLSASDESRVVAWLASQGLTTNERSRGRNWVAFSGTAAQIGRAFHTSIHRYEVNGKMHFANAAAPSVPEALADVVGGFLGLNDFTPQPQTRVLGPPDFTSGSTHYLAPGDWMAIYDVAPLAAGGYDGSGQNIAVVGQSDIVSSDISGFRSLFGLPSSTLRVVLFGSDPGYNGAQIEGNLDVEWSGAIAPKATVYYVEATDAFLALTYAVSQNIAPVIGVSYGICENDSSPIYESVAQQANAQGITIVVASGDSGAGGCDVQEDAPLAAHGPSVQFPGNLPEVTSMGGTMFNDAAGTWWGAKNSTTGASAFGYIPEMVWNENTLQYGLGASGGGPSGLIAKPAWQNGPGVPNDGARDTPDLAVASAGHDGYLVTEGSSLLVVGGTSAAAPSMAGLVTLLNQYVVKQGIQATAGLGNINPQLYRMAQTSPAAFHDIVAGSNAVPCVQGSPGCATGTFGASAGAGYDLATGLGSIDANQLFDAWRQATAPVAVTLTVSSTAPTLNDTITATATVSPVQGSGVPTGTVSFVCNSIALGSAPLANVAGIPTASVSIAAWQVGTCTIGAEYSGDAAFSPGGATVTVKVSVPTAPGVSGLRVLTPNPVFGQQTGNQPPTWEVPVTFLEFAGVPALVTGFTIDGVKQEVSQTFPSANIPARGSLAGTVVLRNVSTPSIKTFTFTGTDAGGNAWSREVQIAFRQPYVESEINFNLWGSPLTVEQDPAPATNCLFPQLVTLDEVTGYELHVVGLVQGSVDISSSITHVFGTTRLAPWGSLQGKICWNPAVTPSSDLLLVVMEDDFGDELAQEINVNFAAASGSGQRISASPAAISVRPASLLAPATPATVAVQVSDATQTWTASVFPQNPTTGWLSLSQHAGTGPGSIALSTNATGFAPGVYRATIVLESPHAAPEWVTVPVMWVNAAASPSAPVISSVGNSLSGTAAVAPGSLVSIYGSQLASSAVPAVGLPLAYSLGGVSVTVNGWPAPLLYVSPGQINIQVPYEAGAGPGVIGVNNNGLIGGFAFQTSAAAPGIYAWNGSVYPGSTAVKGGYATMYVTGAGELNQALATGVAASGSALALPGPRLPVNVTVGGLPALVQFAGAAPGTVGLIQVNFIVPKDVDAGVQPVVITVDGAPSMAANLTVTE
ncbi:MAG TPA: protease pro-enzyme activation domain-containing protein [Bryobacteraceae bacterium]|nr:protease pro-enzyme activation domain-containing protein [Bryobacteraceae bacterium]